MAFGDGDNDADLLAAARPGIAVQGSSPAARRRSPPPRRTLGAYLATTDLPEPGRADTRDRADESHPADESHRAPGARPAPHRPPATARAAPTPRRKRAGTGRRTRRRRAGRHRGSPYRKCHKGVCAANMDEKTHRTPAGTVTGASALVAERVRLLRMALGGSPPGWPQPWWPVTR
ncbi:hypothetical protein NKH77_53410 [Streptomyces sp. M19]